MAKEKMEPVGNGNGFSRNAIFVLMPHMVAGVVPLVTRPMMDYLMGRNR